MELSCENDTNTTVLEFIPKLHPWMQGVFVIVDIFIFLATTIGNVLVILSVLMYRKLRTPTNIFVSSLSTADLFVSCICIPVDLALGLGFLDDTSLWACLAGSSLVMSLSVVSVLHLDVIAYDRYLAITDPFNYQLKMSKKRISVLIAIAWSVAAFFLIAPLCGLNKMRCYNRGYCDMMWVQTTGVRTAAIAIAGVISLNLMSYMYLEMYKLARKARLQIKVTTNVQRTAWVPGGSSQPEVKSQHRSMNSDLKAAKTVALIMGCFMIAWTPASALSVLDLFTAITPKVAYQVYPYQLIFFHMAFSNSAMNPIIYAYRNKDFRYMFLKILNKFFRCHCWNQRVSAAAEQSLDRVASIAVPSIVVSNTDEPKNIVEDL